MLTSNLLFSWVSNRLKQKFYSSPQISANQKVADVDVDNILMDKYKTRHITTWYATRIEWIAYPQKRSLNAIYWAFCLSLYLSLLQYFATPVVAFLRMQVFKNILSACL